MNLQGGDDFEQCFRKNPKTSDTSASGHFSGAAGDRRCLGSLRCGAALGQDLFDATTSWLDSIRQYLIEWRNETERTERMLWTLSSRAGLERLYGNALVEFRQLAKQMDPEGKFCNEILALSIGTNIEQNVWTERYWVLWENSKSSKSGSEICEISQVGAADCRWLRATMHNICAVKWSLTFSPFHPLGRDNRYSCIAWNGRPKDLCLVFGGRAVATQWDFISYMCRHCR